MNNNFPYATKLRKSTETIIHLTEVESTLRSQDIAAIEHSLRNVTSPTFEIAFVGAFSAGKSMLINALLGRELLYSAEGHATGIECYIAHAESDQERVVLTFLSSQEIQSEAQVLLQELGVTAKVDFESTETVATILDTCTKIVEKEGGDSKSEKGKTAKALKLLMEGWDANREHIEHNENATYAMEQLDLTTLQDGAAYARRGCNSAVLKRLEYYCHHDLLLDGNILVDLPGIDAPVKEDAALTYEKIAREETSAVVVVLKPASAGDMTREETDLLEVIRNNQSIRDRVFFVFNRIDETWYNMQLRQRLNSLISSQFGDSSRLYKTSGLLGFYGSQIQKTSKQDRFGLDSIFSDSIKNTEISEETPQFVYEFNRYCSSSGKLPANQFRISVNNYESQNENYIRILNEYGTPLIQQLIDDSGIEVFRTAVTRYLTEEKRPQLFAALANDLQPVCVALRRLYLERWRELDSQPTEIEGIKSKRLEGLNHDLVRLGTEFKDHIEREINTVVTNQLLSFEDDFKRLQVRMMSRLEELLNSFSVKQVYQQATLAHPRNSTAPFLAILVEAFYYLSNELEDVLIAEIERTIDRFFKQLLDRIRHQDYYRELCRLMGSDIGLEERLGDIQRSVYLTLRSEASTECDRYVRESPEFYREDSASIFQFREVLMKTSSGYDCLPMVEAEPAIRQLLKLDFEPKVQRTVQSTFRQAVSQTLKSQLVPLAANYSEFILGEYKTARLHLESTIEKEAQVQLAMLSSDRDALRVSITTYNDAVRVIDECLQSVGCDRFQLPLVEGFEGSDS
jgi:replication fork clamp-binding protein CrfC